MSMFKDVIWIPNKKPAEAGWSGLAGAGRRDRIS